MRHALLFGLATIFQHASCEVYSLPDTAYGDSLDITYENDKVVMTAKVKMGSWLGFGWGPDMD